MQTVNSKNIREWAAKQEPPIEVKRSGRVPKSVIEAYLQAHSEPAPETPKKAPESAWMVRGRQQSEARARLRIHQLMRAYM
jgi:hypothetical protein